MRPVTQQKIDELHAEIARLVELEREWLAHTQPATGIRAQIRDARLACATWSPAMRAAMREATASLPSAYQQRTQLDEAP
jgi:hypothetical protein